jgi:hypothetical protein
MKFLKKKKKLGPREVGFPERCKRKGKAPPAEKPGDPAGPTGLSCCRMYYPSIF